jgi:cob(I)alamin adenosyltransferase
MSKSAFYTAKGDLGDTGRLAGTERIAKSSALIEAIGTIDEATSAIGMARALSQSDCLRAALPTVQRHVFGIMSHLSAVSAAREQYAGVTDEDLTWLQNLIADIEKHLPPVKDFVLPGDSQAGAAFHVARTIVRRAERRLVALVEGEPRLGKANLAYMNRLSSLMFVAALYENITRSTQP